ncbi:hypothetical protein [Streptomyces sp. NPDC056387]|uniref:hypothetical protein n=1 Tax=Streptomyces sp. NPDC056387 TaxID=3345803 RepID=UPI0035D5E000
MTGAGMTSFDDVYGLPDPRGHFGRLGPYGYQTPGHAQPVFRALAGELPPERRAVLDLCCSYGIDAALLNHDLTLDDLYAHYTSPRPAGRPAPVAAFVLRTHDYRPIAGCLESYGLTVERAGKESAGYFHTRLLLAR